MGVKFALKKIKFFRSKKQIAIQIQKILVTIYVQAFKTFFHVCAKLLFKKNCRQIIIVCYNSLVNVNRNSECRALLLEIYANCTWQHFCFYTVQGIMTLNILPIVFLDKINNNLNLHDLIVNVRKLIFIMFNLRSKSTITQFLF